MAETSCTYVGGCLKMESERPKFETQPTNFFFFRASRLAPVRALSLQSAGSYHCNCDSTLGYDAGFYPSFVSCTHTVLQVVVVETFFIDTASMCTKKAHFARQSFETSTKHEHLSRLCWWKRLKMLPLLVTFDWRWHGAKALLPGTERQDRPKAQFFGAWRSGLRLPVGFLLVSIYLIYSFDFEGKREREQIDKLCEVWDEMTMQ